MITPGPRVRQLGPVLAIEAVTTEDAGVYRCTASNAGGEASAELRMIVSTPLHIEVNPPSLSVHMGGSAEFKCVVGTQGGGPHLVTWYKDGRQLPSTGRGTSETLIINNVGREDRGMYQCIVRRAEGDTAQAAAELQLGGICLRHVRRLSVVLEISINNDLKILNSCNILLKILSLRVRKIEFIKLLSFSSYALTC